MAVTLVRPTPTDDDGTGNTGTIFDAAWLTDFENRIDNALALLLPLAGGNVTGNVNVSGNLGVGTTSPQNKFVVSNGGAAGIEFGPSSGSMFGYNRSTVAYAPLFIGGSTLTFHISGSNRLGIDASGVIKFDAYTAATFVAGDKYLVVDAAGVIHRSALGPAS